MSEKKEEKKVPSVSEIENQIHADKRIGDFQNYVMTEGTKEKQGIKHNARHDFYLFLAAVVLVVAVIISIMMIIGGNVITNNINVAAIGVIIAIGFIYLLAFDMQGLHGRKTKIIMGLILIAGALLVLFASGFVDSIFAIILGILGIVFGFASFLEAYLEIKDKAKGYGWNILVGLAYVAVGIALILSKDREDLLRVLLGVYFLVMCLNMLWSVLEALFYVHPELKHKVSFTLPIMIAAGLPIGFFAKVNQLVKTDPEKLKKWEEADTGAPPDMVVYVHTRAGMIPGFGHCDVLFDGIVYSYGDYDLSKVKMGGFIADGVMGYIPPEKQVEFALSYSKKILVAYGLRLSEAQKTAVREKIQEIMKDSYYWATDAERAQKGELPGPPEKYEDIGSLMYMIEGTKFYKFHEGSKYKTYYGLGMNCVELVNDIVGPTGLDLIKINGMLSPGNYLEYLDELYTLGDTIVIDRRLYRLVNGKAEQIPMLDQQPINIAGMSN